MREIVLINITGKDKPGLTASLTRTLAEYNVTILDMGQAVIHDFLSLGILIEIPDQHNPPRSSRRCFSRPTSSASPPSSRRSTRSATRSGSTSRYNRDAYALMLYIVNLI